MNEKPDHDFEGYVAYPFTLHGLQHAVDARSVQIDPQHKLGAMFFAIEFGGEAGEALNKVKKLIREALNIPGSRTSVDELGDEIADTIITACNLARCYKIDLDAHIRSVFNRTSRERGLTVMLPPR